MTDEEVECRYYEMQLERLNNIKVNYPEPKKTNRIYFTSTCKRCKGTGKIPQTTSGWYIEYAYQDWHETSDVMSKEEAVKIMVSNTDKSVMLTLIGPDGMVYTI